MKEAKNSYSTTPAFERYWSDASDGYAGSSAAEMDMLRALAMDAFIHGAKSVEPEQQPVAWRWSKNGGPWVYSEGPPCGPGSGECDIEPLYSLSATSTPGQRDK